MNTSLCNVVAFDFHDIISQKCVHFFPFQINTKKYKDKIQQNKKYNNNKYKIKKWMPCFPLQINTQTPAPKRLFTATDSIMFTASLMHSIMHIIMHSIVFTAQYWPFLLTDIQCKFEYRKAVHCSVLQFNTIQLPWLTWDIYYIECNTEIQKYRNTKYRRCTVHCSLPGWLGMYPGAGGFHH